MLAQPVRSWEELQAAMTQVEEGRRLCLTNASDVLPGDPERFADLVAMLMAGRFRLLFHGEPREEGVTRGWLRRAGLPVDRGW